MNATIEYIVLSVKDGYSIREAGRKASESLSCAGTVESLKLGEARTTLAEQDFTRYLARRNGQGYTFEDLEAAKAFLPARLSGSVRESQCKAQAFSKEAR